MENRIFSLFFSIILLGFSIVSCSSRDGGSTSSSTPPLSYCSTVTSYSSPITITGSAVYQYRNNGNGAVAGPNPIRHAEVRVTNSEGSIIQCGETDASGNFSLQLPSNGSTATLTVASRSDNNFVKVYILNNPTNNSFHGVSTNITLDRSKSAGILTASATGNVAGGAFNILDKILDANEFLRTNTESCGATFSCTAFTVAPLVYTYWSPGVNPGRYFGIGPLSFYLPERNELYILGGSNGDIDNSDTDHFDNTIILHEYGHYIENRYSITNSPGGEHNGDNILDPRLAWGEAWANFFQVQVTGIPFYRDTFGTPLGTNGVFVNENLESGSADTPTEAEEGNFREFSVTRALVDLLDADDGSAPDDIQATFEEFWSVFTASSGSFADTNQRFRAPGLFWTLQSVLSGGTDWTTVLGAEEQLVGIDNFGNTLSNGTACPVTIQAENVPGALPNNNPGRQPEDGSFINSNMFKSNDFYRIDHTGGNLSVQMTYTTTPGNAADIDIYLYREDYVFGYESSVAAFSDDAIAISASGATESFSVSNLDAGTYMLNINYNTQGGIRSAASYSLSVNGQSKCPD